MKTVLLVPGFRESLESRDYAAVMKAIEARGYSVRFVPISWLHTGVGNWVKELEEVYGGYDPADTVLAGFSYGAVTALVAAAERTPAELWLFSLSPYFAEDIPKLKKGWLNHIGKRRVEEFRRLSIRELVARISCRALIFYGEKEGWAIVKERAVGVHELMPGSALIEVPEAGHDVADPRYIKAIEKLI